MIKLSNKAKLLSAAGTLGKWFTASELAERSGVPKEDAPHALAALVRDKAMSKRSSDPPRYQVPMALVIKVRE